MARASLTSVLKCPHCGEKMKIISAIEDPEVIRSILEHLGLPTGVPTPHPARTSASQGAFDEIVYDLDDL